MSEGPTGQRENLHGAVLGEGEERTERIDALCERLRTELKETDALGLKLPAALLDNAIVEIAKQRVPNLK